MDFKTEAYRAKGERYRWGYLAMACTSERAQTIEMRTAGRAQSDRQARSGGDAGDEQPRTGV